MSQDSPLSPADHVRLTRDFMDAGRRLDRLLELTCGVAPPGGPALQLVWPAIGESIRPNWALLSGCLWSPRTTAQVGEGLRRALDALDPWSGPALASVFEQVAAASQVPPAQVRLLASVCMLGEPTPLPLEAVLQVVGRDSSLLRLDRALRTFGMMQMVG